MNICCGGKPPDRAYAGIVAAAQATAKALNLSILVPAT
jgi:hypothetical protein